MLSYEETMALGRSQYADIIDDLHQMGLPAEFMQTGGMNAALEVRLEGGYSILVTESDDSLAWSRDDHRDWGAALFPPRQQYDGDCLVADTSNDGSTAALLALLDRLMKVAIQRPNR